MRHIGEFMAEFNAAHCRLCGGSRNLQQHHIVPRRITRCDDPDNLVTLCLGCHDDVHNHRVDLAPALRPEEQAKAVLLTGSLELAHRLLTPLAYRTVTHTPEAA